MVSTTIVLLWSLGFLHVLNCCNWVLAGDDFGAPQGDDTDLNYGSIYYDWSPSPPLFRSFKWPPFSRGSSFGIKQNKRSVYGILGLATNRPHKTAADIQYSPPQDSFVSVRGRKKRSTKASALSPNLSPLEMSSSEQIARMLYQGDVVGLAGEHK